MGRSTSKASQVKSGRSTALGIVLLFILLGTIIPKSKDQKATLKEPSPKEPFPKEQIQKNKSKNSWA
jgi:hypothetical protein